MQRTQQPLDKQLTHGAIEVLTSLSEEFVETIFDEEDPR